MAVSKPKDVVSLRTWCLALCCIMCAVLAWRIGTMRRDISKLQKLVESQSVRIEARDKLQSGRQLDDTQRQVLSIFSRGK